MDNENQARTMSEPILPPRQYFLQEHEVHIKFFSRGCMVSVGCRTVAFESVKEAMRALQAYVENPLETKDYWYEVFDKDEQ